DVSLATELARRAGLALENDRLVRVGELARVRAEAAASRALRLQTVVDATFSSAQPDEFLEQLLDRLREAIGAAVATVLGVEDDGLVVRRTVGVELPERSRVARGSGLAGLVAATRTHQVTDEVDSTEFGIPAGRSTKLAAAAGAPLIADGALVGVLQVGSID